MPLVQHDDIYFPVVERPAGFVDRNGNWHKDEDHKYILRQHPDDSTKPVALGIVSAGYKLIDNRSLFEAFEAKLHARFPAANINTHTERAYLGARVGRTYRVNTMRRQVAQVGDVVAFNVFARNSYDGSARFRVGWSIENLVCTNQLVTATDKEVFVRRHTQGLSIEGIADKLDAFADNYQRQTLVIDQWANVQVKQDDAQALLAEFPGMSDVWRKNMFMHAVHGTEWPMMFWRFLNVMTFWATHGTVRNTRTDNTQAVRWDRQNKVRQWLNTPAVKKLIAA
jgi:hypothetical protein